MYNETNIRAFDVFHVTKKNKHTWASNTARVRKEERERERFTKGRKNDYRVDNEQLLAQIIFNRFVSRNVIMTVQKGARNEIVK